MSNDRRVLIHPDRESLASGVAARFLTKLLDILDEQDLAHICLTGGTVAQDVLLAIAANPARNTIDWDRVHFWWSDERWLPIADPERNALMATESLLMHIPVPASNIHPFAASDQNISLEIGAEAYIAELAIFSTDGKPFPAFDITFLGVGSDGHVASLFPRQPGVHEQVRPVITVDNSPKPPLQRLSLSRLVLNNSLRVWLVLAGADKASALGLALAGASRDEVPAAGIRGRHSTFYFVDRAAGGEVPEDLISNSY